MVTRRPSVATAAYSCEPRSASVVATWESRVCFVAGAPDSRKEREKLASQISPSARTERMRAPCRIAVRIPWRRSSRVGPWTSSRSAWASGAIPSGTTRSTRVSLPLRTNATSTVTGAGFAAFTRAAAAALGGAADGSRSTASKPANASTRATSEIRIPGEPDSPRSTKCLRLQAHPIERASSRTLRRLQGTAR